MKASFHHRLVNDRFEDPCLYVRLVREGRAFLFDAGNIDRLRPGDLQKISDVFVTHTHVDHFIGFDTLLRAALRRETPLRVYGPETITGCVEGKLRGYTWNLIEEYPAKIEVYSVGQEKVLHSSFYAENRFERVERKARTFDGVALNEPPITVKAVIFSHGIPCLGFTLEEDVHINIDKAALQTLGLPVGAWLRDFKRMVREKADPETPLPIGKQEWRFSEVLPIARITRGQKIAYVTDISPDEENVRKAVELAKASDTLYCEAYFLDAERERATERHHLTAKMAGEIARKAGVKNLVIIHSSPKYRDAPAVIEAEAMKEFKR